MQIQRHSLTLLGSCYPLGAHSICGCWPFSISLIIFLTSIQRKYQSSPTHFLLLLLLLLSTTTMKITSIAVSLCLAVSSSIASATKLRALHAEDSGEDGSVQPQPRTWFKPEVPDTCTFPYHTVFFGDELNLTPVSTIGSVSHYQWTKFYRNAPEGCKLARIDTKDDLIKAQAAVASANPGILSFVSLEIL